MLWSIRLRSRHAFRRVCNRHKVAVQPEDRIHRYDYCALNDVLQLTNVSRPWIVHQVLHRFPVKRRRSSSPTAWENRVTQKATSWGMSERRSRQRGKLDGKNVEAVEEV